MSPKATSKSKPKKETEKASPKKVTKTSKASAKGPKKMTKTPDLLRGFRDILPEEQAVWDRIRDTLRSMARAYSFDRIDLPVLEKTDVFERDQPCCFTNFSKSYKISKNKYSTNT